MSEFAFTDYLEGAEVVFTDTAFEYEDVESPASEDPAPLELIIKPDDDLI